VIWFPAKRYGWGWGLPVAWQGWVVLLAWLALFVGGWACDFLQTYDIWFRPTFAFFIVDVNTLRVVHFGATRAPSAAWAAQ
jgi:hypothetical protein